VREARKDTFSSKRELGGLEGNRRSWRLGLKNFQLDRFGFLNVRERPGKKVGGFWGDQS